MDNDFKFEDHFVLDKLYFHDQLGVGIEISSSSKEGAKWIYFLSAFENTFEVLDHALADVTVTSELMELFKLHFTERASTIPDNWKPAAGWDVGLLKDKK